MFHLVFSSGKQTFRKLHSTYISLVSKHKSIQNTFISDVLFDSRPATYGLVYSVGLHMLTTTLHRKYRSQLPRQAIFLYHKSINSHVKG